MKILGEFQNPRVHIVSADVQVKTVWVTTDRIRSRFVAIQRLPMKLYLGFKLYHAVPVFANVFS